MFTGLIEEMGVIESLITSDNSCDLLIRGNIVSGDVAIGDSIAINGCCLTVTHIDRLVEEHMEGAVMTFQAGTETLSRTNLGELKVGDRVNLERSLQVGQRLGGHYVTGHVDAVGTVAARNDDGEWAEFWFDVPPELTKQMASKGSIAVDGISLTLVNVASSQFSVALIPHTLSVTTLGQRQVGSRVNLETDVLAKYVQQQLQSVLAP